jgi:ZIP family zinc transporter
VSISFICAVSFISSSIGLLVLLVRRQNISPAVHALLTGGSAGVMLGASFVSLLGPATQMIRTLDFSGQWILAAGCFLLGALAMEAIHAITPHEHEIRGFDGGAKSSTRWRRGVLISGAMALHNLPEGLALGIGGLQDDPQLVRGLLYGIAGQNIPEGAMTALAMLAAGVPVRLAALGVLITALVEALGAALGLLAGPLMLPVLPWALIFCGGAMIYVISQEMIPESHAQGKERIATFSLISGLISFGWVTL